MTQADIIREHLKVAALTVPELMALVGCHRNTVSNTLCGFRDEGILFAVQEPDGTVGRPLKRYRVREAA